jgi:hypothetical protein
VRLTYYQHHGRKLARAAVYGSARMIDQIVNDVHARAARLPLNADGAPPPPVTLGDFTAAAQPARRRRGPASRWRGGDCLRRVWPRLRDWQPLQDGPLRA